MASESASNLLWLALSLAIALAISGGFVVISANIVETIEDDTRAEVGDKQSRVSIINAPGELYQNETNGNVSIFMKNTGSRNLFTEQIVIGISGHSFTADDMNLTVVDGSRWSPGNVVRAEFNVSLEEGEYDLWVTVPGLSSGGYREGSAEDEVVVRVDNND